MNDNVLSNLQNTAKAQRHCDTQSETLPVLALVDTQTTGTQSEPLVDTQTTGTQSEPHYASSSTTTWEQESELQVQFSVHFEYHPKSQKLYGKKIKVIYSSLLITQHMIPIDFSG